MASRKTWARVALSGGILLLVACGTLAYRANAFGSREGRPAPSPAAAAAQGAADPLGPELAPAAVQGGRFALAEPKPGRAAAAPVDERAMSTIAIARSSKEHARQLDYAEIRSLVRRAVELAGGLGGVLRDGMTVVLKPNLVTPIDYTLPGWQGRPLAPEANGTTTDYRFTRAVVELVRELDPHGKVYVMEGSAFSTRDCMRRLRYNPRDIPGVDEFIAIEEDSGGWRDFSSSRLVAVPVKEPLLAPSVYMNRRYKEADLLISLPVLKTHWTEVVSGSIKNVSIGGTPANIYGGPAPGSNNRSSGLDHDKAKLDKWIADWFKARPAQFAIMDGLQGIQNGPTPCFEQTGATDIRQDQMDMRLVLAGRDCVALDSVESLVMEWDPAAAGYIGYLAQAGLGKSGAADIRVVGERVDLVRKDFAGTYPEGKLTRLGGPGIELERASISRGAASAKGGLLEADLALGPEVRKVEVYRGKEYMGTYRSSSGGRLSIDLPGIDAKALVQDIGFLAYDAYLNVSERKLRIMNDPASGLVDAVSLVEAGDYEAPKAAAAPKIDGIGDDAAWAEAPWRPLAFPWASPPPDSPADFSGAYKLLWTADRLYLLARIRDDAFVDSHPDPLDRYWEDDALEIFLDEDRSGGDHKASYNAFAYHLGLSGDVVDLGADGKPALFPGHVVSARKKEAGGVMVWEAEIKVFASSYSDATGAADAPVRLFAGKDLGFMLAYCDSDGKRREHFVGSLPMPEGRDYGWLDASVFGSLKLVERGR
jgi:uncharacterized protein (DUF362 family)